MPNLDPVQGKVIISSDTKGVDQAKSSLGGFGSILQQVGIVAGGLGLANLAGQMIDVGKAAFSAGINTASFYEQSRIGLTTLLGNATKANAVLAQVQKDALATPFDATALVRGNQLLISAGVAASQARVDVLNLGNAVMATGGGNDELSRMLVNLQQIKNVGSATALDVKQFGYAGINIYKLLEDSTGKNIQQIKDSKITYEDLTKALAKAAGTGGMYAGAIKNAGNSYQQVFSNMKEASDVFFANLLIKTGIFDTLKNVMSGLTNFINNTFNPTLNKNATGLNTLGNVIKSIGGHIQTAFMPLIKQLTDVYVRHKDQIDAIAQALGTLLYAAIVIVIYVASAFLQLITAMVDTLLNNFGPALKGIADLINNLGNVWSAIVAVMKSTFGDFVNFVISGINLLIDAVNKVAKIPGIGLLAPGLGGVNLGHIGYIDSGSKSASPQLNGAAGLTLQQAIRNSGGVSITNNVTNNTPFDLNSFNSKLGLQISGNR